MALAPRGATLRRHDQGLRSSHVWKGPTPDPRPRGEEKGSEKESHDTSGLLPNAASMNAFVDVHRWLSDWRQYARQIDRLHARYLFSPALYYVGQRGVPLATLVMHRSHVARLIARTVAAGGYRFEPAKARTVRVDGKERVVYVLRPTDRIVHGVVADLLASAAPMDGNVFSYRRGLSWWTAVARCAEYVRRHRRAHPDPKTRGLYVLRRDIDSYTDSIPVGGRSPLWRQLRGLLESAQRGAPVVPQDWRIIEQVIRIEAVRHHDAPFTLLRGVPTGQPVASVLFNVYLGELDRELASIPGGFYARYSDDLLFAHADAEVVRTVDARIRARLRDLFLTINESKARTLYLTGAGRASLAWPAAQGTTSVPFLGCAISADATVALEPSKVRRLLSDLERRAFETRRMLSGADRDRLGRAVSAAINRAFDIGAEAVQERSAALLRRAITDRRQLKQLDYAVARLVLRVVTGDASAAAFRRVPFKALRREWGLVSLLHARNTWPKAVANARDHAVA